MTTRRNDIDGLRGISIILVVLFHSFPNLFPGFFIGVDIFFVISGYVITHLLISNNKNIHLLEFYTRRVIRIFPALILIFFFALFGVISLTFLFNIATQAIV